MNDYGKRPAQYPPHDPYEFDQRKHFRPGEYPDNGYQPIYPLMGREPNYPQHYHEQNGRLIYNKVSLLFHL